MADQNAAKFILVPLFLLRPALTLGLVQFSHQFQALLVGVVTQLALQQALVKIEALGREGGRVGEAGEQLL